MSNFAQRFPMKYVITRIILDQKLNLTKQSITLELRNEMHHN